jgi:phosphoribosyl-ATP pyrophosphohydrolase
MNKKLRKLLSTAGDVATATPLLEETVLDALIEDKDDGEKLKEIADLYYQWRTHMEKQNTDIRTNNVKPKDWVTYWKETR